MRYQQSNLVQYGKRVASCREKVMEAKHKYSNPFSLVLILTVNELLCLGLVVVSIICAGLYLKQTRLRIMNTNHIMSAQESSNHLTFALSITNYTSILVSNLANTIGCNLAFKQILELESNISPGIVFLKYNVPISVSREASNHATLFYLSNKWHSDITSLSNLNSQLSAELTAVSNKLRISEQKASESVRDRLALVEPTKNFRSKDFQMSFLNLSDSFAAAFQELIQTQGWSNVVRYVPAQTGGMSKLAFTMDYFADLNFKYEQLGRYVAENDGNRILGCSSDVGTKTLITELSFTNISHSIRQQLSNVLARNSGWDDILKVEFSQKGGSDTLSLTLTRPVTEGELRKELLGLKGQMNNVVFVIDVSASMNDGHRWASAKETIKAWIQYLPIEKCAVLCFNQSIIAFPTGETPQTIDVADTSSGRANRKLIGQFLEQQEPAGFTDTPKALRKAYELKEADTIILFTDGRPALKKETHIDRELEKKTYDLIKDEQSRRRRPINVVGIGNYFDPEFGEYLSKIATNTGGCFIGR